MLMFHMAVLVNGNGQKKLPVGSVCDGKDMGRHLMSLLPLVDLNDLLCVDGKPLVGVHHHAEQTGVGLVQKV